MKNPAAVGRRRPAAHHEKAPSVKERGEAPQAKGTATRYMQNHYLSARSLERCRNYSGPSSQTTTEPTKMKIFESKATRPNSRFLSIFVGSVVVYDGER